MYCSNCGSENNFDANFCFHCGARLTRVSDTSQPDNDVAAPIGNSQKPEKFHCWVENTQCYVSGSLAKMIKESFCTALKVESFDKVLCNIYVNREYLVLVPKSKDRTAFRNIGMILGGGAAFSVLFGAAGASLDKLMGGGYSKNQTDLLHELKNVLVLDARNITVQATDERTSWNIEGGDWFTAISIHGQGVFNENEGHCEIVCNIEGRSNVKTWHAKPNNKINELCALLEVQVPEIKEVKNKFGFW